MEPGDCLDETILQGLAAGIAPVDALERSGEHLANCDRCASRLRRYLHEFSDELTPKEQAIIDQLESSYPEGQQTIVKILLRCMNDRRDRQ
jgi:hypothetical protein